MAEDEIVPDATDQSEQWNVARFETALAQLERLQEQLDGLRSTIPSLIMPLVRPIGTRAQVFGEIRKAALQSTADLESFRQDWKSAGTQQLFSKTKESLDKSSDLSKAKDVPKYGWISS